MRIEIMHSKQMCVHKASCNISQDNDVIHDRRTTNGRNEKHIFENKVLQEMWKYNNHRKTNQ